MTLGRQQLRASLSHRYSNVWQAATLGRANQGSSCTYLWISCLSSHKMSCVEGQLCHALFFLLSILIMQQLNNTNRDASCCWPGFHFQSIDEVFCKGELSGAIIRRLISCSLSQVLPSDEQAEQIDTITIKKQWITMWCAVVSSVVEVKSKSEKVQTVLFIMN